MSLSSTTSAVTRHGDGQASHRRHQYDLPPLASLTPLKGIRGVSEACREVLSIQRLETEFAAGESCTGATEPNLCRDPVDLVTDATPDPIGLAELTEPFFTVSRA